MSSGKIYIMNGTVIDPSSGRSETASIVIDKGVIVGVEKQFSLPSKIDGEVIDASGCWVTPGLIDIHVHLREPGQEWKETIATGGDSALAGGFTSVCCMPNTSPTIDNAEVSRFILEATEKADRAKVYPIGAVTVGRAGKELAPLYELAKAGCVAFSDDGDPVWDAGVMRRALEIAKDLDIPIACHEEELSVTRGGTSSAGVMDECGRSFYLGLPGMPASGEEIHIARDIELARETGGHVHICHLSTARGALLVKRAKEDGIPVTAEVTPHHLHLTHNDVDGIDTNYKMSPPLRSNEDREALRSALADGTIDVIASDHAPHERDSKECEFTQAAMGMVGFQTTLALTLDLVRSGALSKERAIESLTTGPAEIFRLPKAELAEASVADITIINPDEEWEFTEENNLSKSNNSPYIGKTLQGKVKATIVDGRMKFRDDSNNKSGN